MQCLLKSRFTVSKRNPAEQELINTANNADPKFISNIIARGMIVDEEAVVLLAKQTFYGRCQQFVLI
ncbi:hypothetical protein L596_005478 [Steinernema carpocapsae]|uniref:Uncharacterized protein n=1 Tax=Steinernema carpocapsae TaxID=34508 RepID=A0A4U8UZD9_STECR|nr:hypothetical protein L596_005478 [Steinernema carpocapsae]